LEKPIRFTKHAVVRLISLGLTEDDVIKSIKDGMMIREGKIKFKAAKKGKKGRIVATCADYPDHILVITVSKGGDSSG
jgi:hypothetical protein